MAEKKRGRPRGSGTLEPHMIRDRISIRLPRHLIEELERLPGSSRGEKVERALKFAIDEGLFEEGLNLTRQWGGPPK